MVETSSEEDTEGKRTSNVFVIPPGPPKGGWAVNKGKKGLGLLETLRRETKVFGSFEARAIMPRNSLDAASSVKDFLFPAFRHTERQRLLISYGFIVSPSLY